MIENARKKSKAPSRKRRKDDSESKSVIKKWDEACLLAITTMSTISQFNFAKLWPLGVPEENFVNMFWKTGLFLFENSSENSQSWRNARSHRPPDCRYSEEVPWDAYRNRLWLIAIDEQESTEGISKLAVPVCNILTFLQSEFQDKALAVELLKEIGEMALYDGAQDSKSLGQCCRNIGQFLVQTSKSLPGILLANFSYILPQLDRASYPLRSLICESLGNLVIGLHEGVFIDKPSQEDPSGDNESEAGNLKDMVKDKASGRQTRDTLLDLLLERSRDRTSFTRSSLLKSWTNMIDAQAVPVRMILRVTKMTSRHLLDHSSLVRKAAIQLFSAIIRKNPFAPILHPDYFDEQLETLLDKLRQKGLIYLTHCLMKN